MQKHSVSSFLLLLLPSIDSTSAPKSNLILHISCLQRSWSYGHRVLILVWKFMFCIRLFLNYSMIAGKPLFSAMGKNCKSDVLSHFQTKICAYGDGVFLRQLNPFKICHWLLSHCQQTQTQFSAQIHTHYSQKSSLLFFWLSLLLFIWLYLYETVYLNKHCCYMCSKLIIVIIELGFFLLALLNMLLPLYIY